MTIASPSYYTALSVILVLCQIVINWSVKKQLQSVKIFETSQRELAIKFIPEVDSGVEFRLGDDAVHESEDSSLILWLFKL